MENTSTKILSNIKESSINETNKELVNFIAEIARQPKYDNNENAISEIFEEAKSLIEDYEENISPMSTVEETLSWLRCDK